MFILVLDGDSREMENDLKAVAGEYGHALQPLFLPGDASPEQWLWGILRIRPGEYADVFGLAEADMRQKTDRVEHLVEGAVQQRDAAKTCLRAFAFFGPIDIRRTVPEIARNVGRNEAKNSEIPRISARPEGPNYPLAALLTQTHRSLTDGCLRPPDFRPIRTAHFPSGLHIDSCNMSPEQGIPSNNASRLAT